MWCRQQIILNTSTYGSLHDFYTPQSEKKYYGEMKGWPQGNMNPGFSVVEVGLNIYLKFNIEILYVSSKYILKTLTLVDFDANGRGIYEIKGIDYDSILGRRHGVFHTVLE